MGTEIFKDRRRMERLLVVLVAAHTLCVGIFLLFFPVHAARFGGWGDVRPAFFGSQAGAFHIVLAIGYLSEHFRHRGIALIVVAKVVAAAFLLAWTAIGDVPWAVPFSGAADALMGLAVWGAHRAAGGGKEEPR